LRKICNPGHALGFSFLSLDFDCSLLIFKEGAIAGDDPNHKKFFQQLIDSLGFDVVDTGKLSDSWKQHPGTPAYCRFISRIT
jgi:hypothetical protein